ncbi:U3-containing 90S pre-ribosomal complex subunit-domain containing protein [Staphylotrichum tortipilum]|uniref:U3-containing 90S pre-ribosomal complex subunit-domain containing protein n=1 Tax=Staphylotrichum tortipilum TaxID=2831512 RepID=A0AAN6MT07_9PEZI|nr:U3-containing 90S pre-ribosomal complex subunit-domain containing protein [Staphylotrichum longicolle]
MATEEHTKKRKIQDDDKPRKKQKKQKKVRDDEGDLDMEAGLNRGFERMDGQLLADHIAQKTRRFGTDLSPVELSDLYISANTIRDSTSWKEPRSTENLPAFLEAFSSENEKLDQAPKKCGSPHTIIVAGAGLRAADLVRSVRKFQKKGCSVAKLFAKHFKVEEQVSFLQKTRTGIAVGTPQRLIDLIENDALCLESLKRIVVDASHIDQKKRGIADMRETMMPLAKLLCRKALKERYEDETARHIDLIFY